MEEALKNIEIKELIEKIHSEHWNKNFKKWDFIDYYKD